MPKIAIFGILAIALMGGFIFFQQYTAQRITDAPTQIFEPKTDSTENLSEAPALTAYVTNRQTIWAMDFLPDGRMIFTERHGRVSIVEPDGQVDQIADIEVHAVSESGLHGVAVDPDFIDNRFIYLYYTYQTNGANTLNRVSRYVFENNSLTNEKVIVDNIPGATTHDGGRLKFGPDQFLYITTGDAQEPSLAQDQNSLAGKILRVTRDGTNAPGNPFNTKIYSYGHRNPQGITWDDSGKLWATEHGPTARDELNLVETGGNYGWPEITGNETESGMRLPIVHSGQGTWAPAGAQFFNRSIFFTGLRGNALYEYNLDTGELAEHFKNKFGRIRDIVLGPDGFFYLSTSNRDGRGLPTDTDDQIFRINPTKLGEI